jgi:hypothetical protein
MKYIKVFIKNLKLMIMSKPLINEKIEKSLKKIDSEASMSWVDNYDRKIIYLLKKT